ncbi:MAG: hypothetical protein IVW57_15150 [Ktedonobacterales bacterium]|nr:hypothetical protein [Ktedonobacterales bacterium]
MMSAETTSPEAFDFQNPVAVYAQMRPDQRTAIGLEFSRLLNLSGDGTAPRFALDARGMLSAEQAATLHQYARERHPDIFAQVMRHPVTRSSLASLAQPAAVPTQASGRGWRFWRRR